MRPGQLANILKTLIVVHMQLGSFQKRRPDLAVHLQNNSLNPIRCTSKLLFVLLSGQAELGKP